MVIRWTMGSTPEAAKAIKKEILNHLNSTIMNEGRLVNEVAIKAI